MPRREEVVARRDDRVSSVTFLCDPKPAVDRMDLNRQARFKARDRTSRQLQAGYGVIRLADALLRGDDLIDEVRCSVHAQIIGPICVAKQIQQYKIVTSTVFTGVVVYDTNRFWKRSYAL